MRLFTAIELDDPARESAAAVSDELRRRVQEHAPRARVTWVPAGRLHLTLRFIGEVRDEVAERIISTLRAPLPVAPFVMTLDRPGAFPPTGRPRVLWIGVADGRDASIRAEAAVSDRLAAVGVAREDRPYSPHLTLARVRDSAGLRVKPLFEGVAPRPGQTYVEAITLFQSTLSPRGPMYTVLERTRLQAPR